MFSSSFLRLVGCLAFLPFSLGQSQPGTVEFIPDYILRVTARNISQACISRYSVIINGTAPGPTVKLTEGVTSWIRVYNDMADQNTTVHWHGINVKPMADGSPVSQWPITPGHFFDYEILPPIGSAGSYFYHSHAPGMQALTANGPLIVKDAGKPPYKYDHEKIVFISDQFNRTDADMVAGLLANPFKWTGEVSNVLINGKSAVVNATQASHSCSLEKIILDPSKLYRFRFIGGTALSFVVLAIQNHSNLTLIEADGDYTKPLSVPTLQVGSGQRYSALIQSLDAATLAQHRAAGIYKYYLQLKTLDRPAVFTSFAVIEYSDYQNSTVLPKYELPPSPPPIMLPNTSRTDYPLVPLTPGDFPTAAEVNRTVTINVIQVNNGTSVWLENHEPWTEVVDPVPYAIALYGNEAAYVPNYDRALANGGFDDITRTYPAKVGEVIEIVLQNQGAIPAGGLDSHPFHAHGQHYYDLGSGNGTYDAAANEARLNGTVPVRRDTTMLFRYETMTTAQTDAGWRAWRIRIESPGAWLIHCHILAHMIMGMQTVWVMGDPSDIRQAGPVNVANYVTYGDSTPANISYLSKNPR